MMSNYEQALHQLIKLHSGDAWRKDTKLIHDQLGPLLAKTRTEVDSIIAREQKHAQVQIEELLRDTIIVY